MSTIVLFIVAFGFWFGVHFLQQIIQIDMMGVQIGKRKDNKSFATSN
jgi:hypothetical protein